MAARSLFKMLQYEAKRRAEVGALLQRAGTLTDAEIDAAKVPLPWYRKALREAREIALKEACAKRLMAVETGNFDSIFRREVREDKPGEIWKWNDATRFVKTQLGMETEIRTGDLLFFRDDAVWHDPCFLFGSPSNYENICQFVSLGNRQNYYDALTAKRFAECPLDAPVIDLTGGRSSSPLAMSGISFFM